MGEGLRERKKRETRIALSWAAIRLCVERGLEEVRVEDIAAEAGVSPRTFNNYFTGKAEAIAYRHRERIEQIAAELRSRPAAEPIWEAITGAALVRFGLGLDRTAQDVDMRQWVSGLRLMFAEPSLRGEVRKAGAQAEVELAAAVADRTGTDLAGEMYPRLVAAAVVAAVDVAMAHSLRPGTHVPVTTLLTDALKQISAGLPAPRP